MTRFWTWNTVQGSRRAGLAGRLLFAALLMAAAPLSAQGVLVGRVADERGTPIPGADVRVSSVSQQVTTDADGWFRVSPMPTGLYYFGVRRIGYRPAADLLRFAANDTVDVTLERIGPELDTVRVQARADAAWEREMRRYNLAIDAARFGNVLTARDIEERKPIWTSDLFQTQPGFTVMGGGGGARVLGSRGRCPPAVFVDGQFVPGFGINDIQPRAIKLLVSYRSGASMPAQLQVPRANTNCGAIMVFTI